MTQETGGKTNCMTMLMTGMRPCTARNSACQSSGHGYIYTRADPLQRSPCLGVKGEVKGRGQVGLTQPSPWQWEMPGHQKQQHQPSAQSHMAASFLEHMVVVVVVVVGGLSARPRHVVRDRAIAPQRYCPRGHASAQTEPSLARRRVSAVVAVGGW